MNFCWFNLRRITVIVFTLNLILTSITLLIFFHGPKNSKESSINDEKISTASNPSISSSYNVLDGQDDWVDAWGPGFDDGPGGSKMSQNEFNLPPLVVEIWSKAAIGFYLWEEILKGIIDKGLNNGIYITGSKKVGRVKFNFRSGPALTVDAFRSFISDPSQSKNIVLILNSRDAEKMSIAKSWLEEVKVQSQVSPKPLNIGVVMLGNENCFNSWILPYLSSHGGLVKFLFVTYDWKMINGQNIFQWPLGVATYRDFPVPSLKEIKPHFDRPYVCNFLGTVYPNSSREELLRSIDYINGNSNKLIGRNTSVCLVKGRTSWSPDETPETLAMYVDSLRFSDLTLCPIGMNHESYRIWESISYGSVPVLEENLSHVKYPRSSCDEFSSYRLLKKYQAPVIFISNWTSDLTGLIENEINSVTQEEKIGRRTSLLEWYSKFKLIIRDEFIRAIETKFLE